MFCSSNLSAYFVLVSLVPVQWLYCIPLLTLSLSLSFIYPLRSSLHFSSSLPCPLLPSTSVKCLDIGSQNSTVLHLGTLFFAWWFREIITLPVFLQGVCTRNVMWKGKVYRLQWGGTVQRTSRVVTMWHVAMYVCTSTPPVYSMTLDKHVTFHSLFNSLHYDIYMCTSLQVYSMFAVFFLHFYIVSLMKLFCSKLI